MEFRFASIAWLLLLPPALILVWSLGLRLTALGRARRFTVLALRTTVFTALILALAQMEVTHVSEELAVMIAIDDSDSIPKEMRETAREFVEMAVDQMGNKDRVGILLFGGDASIEHNPQPKAELEDQLGDFQSAPIRSQSNLAEGIRLAMAAFPAHAKKRIVLMSDGNQTAGDAEEAARVAAANHIAVDVFPLSYTYQEDVILEKVVVENRVSVDEPFDVKVFIKSPRDTLAKLHIFRDNQLIASQDVTLEAGKKNRFELPCELEDTGFHLYTAQIEVPGDPNVENNRSDGFTMAAGEPKVLWVEGGPLEEITTLIAMLQAENVDCDPIQPDQFPYTPAELQGYNTIVFSDVAASDISQAQMALVERAVHDMGIGFIMSGGKNSFGAGGWQDTPVEKVLPVNMEIKQKKLLPKGALVTILHTAEIDKQEYWARQISIAALNVLSSRDEFGALAYQWKNNKDQWLVPLKEARDKPDIRRKLLNSSFGDMRAFGPSLQMAKDALAKSNAMVKHIIVISDGDASPPQPGLVSSIRKAGITISTVNVAGHGQYATDAMKDMAKQGGGKFYPVNDPKKLPQIFVKEASVIRKSLIFEETFIPEQKSYSDLLAGFDAKGYPALHGFVQTEAKDLADVPLRAKEDAPLLAYWHYGLGKTAAFTSDGHKRWARDWYQWSKMSKFWSQVVRWSLRAAASKNLQMTTEIGEGQGRVVVDAVDDEGKFLNFLEYNATVIAPDMESQPMEFRQIGPGQYEATFPVEQDGSYLISTQVEGEDGFEEVITGGASQSYSPEYQTSRSNDALLRNIKDIASGRELNIQSLVFDRSLPSGREPKPLWPLLLALGLLVLPIDIFFRRVLLDWAMVREGLGVAGNYARDFLPMRRSVQREERMEALLSAKRQALQDQPEETPAPRPKVSRETLMDRLDKVAAEDLVERPSKSGGGAKSAKPAPAAKKPSADGEPAGGYTSKLLQAKKRAKR